MKVPPPQGPIYYDPVVRRDLGEPECALAWLMEAVRRKSEIEAIWTEEYCKMLFCKIEKMINHLRAQA